MIPTIAYQSDRILIRAYFRARFETTIGAKPGSWPGFVDQFCDHAALRKKQAKGYEDIKKYLVQSFGCRFVDRKELLATVDEKELASLTEKLLPVKRKENRALAENDALLILSVYGYRAKNGEHSGKAALGFSTWWLTNEFLIVSETKDLVAKKGSRYLMRPDFLLNFIALAPRASKIRATHASIFPSTLGLALGRRVDPDVLREILTSLAKLRDLEPARVDIKISEMTDKLKSDLRRKYEFTTSDKNRYSS